MTVAFTGHRVVADKAAVYARLTDTIRDLIQQGAQTFICGGALGFDTLAAQAVLALRREYPILLFLAIPCGDQDAKFTVAQKEEYARIRASADRVMVVSERYTPGCMHERNRYMVDRADVLVAYCHKRTGGSAYTLSYAEKEGKTIIRL